VITVCNFNFCRAVVKLFQYFDFSVGWLRVEWDAGTNLPYRYGRSITGKEFFDLIECDEPRILNNELIAVGCLVERGDHMRS
jgi:hypothetical protein